MHIHRSKCLQGPVSSARPWWRLDEAPIAVFAAGTDTAGSAPRQDDDPTFRADLVARIRRQIAEGTYGTEDQLEKALERLLDRLPQEEE